MSYNKSEHLWVTAIDLELNQPSNQIISLGAVRGSLATGEIAETLHVLVKIEDKLCTDPKICDIPKLTGITDEMLQNEGTTLADLYSRLCDLHKRSDFTNPVTWGKGDATLLRDQLEASGMRLSSGFHNPEKLPVFAFGRREFDCKQRFQEQCIIEGKSLQSGLKKAMKRVGLQFEGQAHNALNDALNTFKMYRFLLKSGMGVKLIKSN